jgi:threonyl-tRNA synthetase
VAKDQKADELYEMRHSLAHIMAGAIQKLWPDTRFGVGPVIEDGWYYDVEPGTTITEDDLPKIEAEMKKIIEADHPFEKSTMVIDEALTWAHEHNQDFKEELLGDLKAHGTTVLKDINPATAGVEEGEAASEVSFYTSGEFMDLCRGPHVESTGQVGAFKLHKVAGAYWRGDETKRQLQRVYGWGFLAEDELKKHIELQEESKQRDHRKLGQELDLFTSSQLVGSGLPLFTPRGTVLRELLGAYSQQLRKDIGFERVWTPHMAKTDLYKTSGHWDKFGDELFLVKSQETSDELVLKPMNCPHHTQIYASSQRSYRDLPIKYMENTTDYRDEKSGELHGIERVRSLTQDDSHVFVSEDGVKDAAKELVLAAQEMYATLGMPLQNINLSFRDESDAYLGDKKLWDKAQGVLEEVAKENGLDYQIDEGEAAFYGPKIDFIAADALGRTTQVATIQLDFIQPERFGLKYTAEDGLDKTPVMIHCALLGTIERFLSVYIEHTAGRFPFWLAPEQIRILTVNDTVVDYVGQIETELKETVLMKPLRHNELRYGLDDRNESLGKKIREAENAKTPLIMIIGPKDQEAGEVSVRADGKEEKVKLDELKEYILGL